MRSPDIADARLQGHVERAAGFQQRQDPPPNRFGQLQQSKAPLGQLGPGALGHGASQSCQPAAEQALQAEQPFGDAGRTDGSGFRQWKRAGRLVKRRQRGHGVGQFRVAGPLGIVGRTGQPGSQFPQVSGVPHEAVMVVRLQRQRNAMKALLVDVPQHRLYELQSLRSGVF